MIIQKPIRKVKEMSDNFMIWCPMTEEFIRSMKEAEK
jgi:hypothetical protein